MHKQTINDKSPVLVSIGMLKDNSSIILTDDFNDSIREELIHEVLLIIPFLEMLGQAVVSWEGVDIIIILGLMGNNHDKYFGSDKRKIIILGLENAGKTTLLHYLANNEVNFHTQKTKNLNIEDVPLANLSVSFFDLAGGERQRVFWKQQFEGTQGIIFVIDSTSSNEDKEKSLEQLDKLTKQLNQAVPIAIALSKVDQMQTITWNSYKSNLSRFLQSKYPSRKNIKVWEIDYKNKQSIKNLTGWLLSQTKPI